MFNQILTFSFFLCTKILFYLCIDYRRPSYCVHPAGQVATFPSVTHICVKSIYVYMFINLLLFIYTAGTFLIITDDIIVARENNVPPYVNEM